MKKTQYLKNYYTRELGSKPRNIALLAIIILIINLIFIGYFGIIKGAPIFKHRLDLYGDLTKINEELHANYEEVNYLRDTLNTPDYQEINLLVPDQKQETEFFKDIELAANLSGLNLIQISNTSYLVDNFNTTVSARLTGEISSLDNFLTNLNSLDRYIYIENISISNNKGSFEDPHKFDLTMEVYNLNSKVEEPTYE